MDAKTKTLATHPKDLWDMMVMIAHLFAQQLAAQKSIRAMVALISTVVKCLLPALQWKAHLARMECPALPCAQPLVGQKILCAQEVWTGMDAQLETLATHPKDPWDMMVMIAHLLAQPLVAQRNNGAMVAWTLTVVKCLLPAPQ